MKAVAQFDNGLQQLHAESMSHAPALRFCLVGANNPKWFDTWNLFRLVSWEEREELAFERPERWDMQNLFMVRFGDPGGACRVDRWDDVDPSRAFDKHYPVCIIPWVESYELLSEGNSKMFTCVL